MPVRLAAVAAALIVFGAAGAGGQSPDLPPRDAFLNETRKALARSQEEWHHYRYKERRTDLHMNPFGRLGTGGTKTFEVRPSPNPRLTYRRMINHDGVPVSSDELTRQDAEYRARVARIKQDAEEDDPAHGQRRRNEDLLARKRAQMMIEDVVNTLQFDLVRREFRNGRPMIVVSFAAKPHARPVTREGRMAKVFRGHLWIDEAEHELTDVKAVATDDVSFGGFVAKIYEGTEATVERREIEPGVWMPTRVTLSGSFRALFRRANINHVVEWFDYERGR